MSENDENEAFMQELKEQFIQTVTTDMADLQELLKGNNFKGIVRIAHDLKGTSKLFGLDEGAEIAKQLQESAQNQEIEKTKTLIDKLTAYMKENNILKNNQ